jgi:hypothetical protein
MPVPRCIHGIFDPCGNGAGCYACQPILSRIPWGGKPSQPCPLYPDEADIRSGNYRWEGECILTSFGDVNRSHAGDNQRPVTCVHDVTLSYSQARRALDSASAGVIGSDDGRSRRIGDLVAAWERELGKAGLGVQDDKRRDWIW